MGRLNPTRQEIHDAHDALGTLISYTKSYEAATGISETETQEITQKLHQDIATLLPPIPPVTLNDIPWDTEKLLFAEVEHTETGERGILIAHDAMPNIGHFIHVLHEGKQIHRYSPGLLTLTGEKYNLTKETPND